MKTLGSILLFVVIFLFESAKSEVCSEYCSSSSCEKESTCSYCKEGSYPYHPVSSNTTLCKFCTPNCRSCSRTNPPNCDICDYGFYETDAKGTACQVCATNCESSLIKGAGKCDTCLVGYTRSSDFSQCQACADNCIACHEAGPGNCDRCKVGYKLQNGKCIKRDCQHGCLCHGDDYNRCDAEDVGFMRVLSRDKTHYVVFSCGSNCDSCSVPGSCDRSGCKKGYTYHEHSDRCVFSGAPGVQLSFAVSLLVLMSYTIA